VSPDKLAEAALPESVYVHFDFKRNGYVWRLKKEGTEIAFRPFDEVRRWDKVYEVAGYVGRRGLKERGLL
jgi:hypothetical protein